MLKAIEKATRQTLTEVRLPSVEDVNAQRVRKFADSITDALGDNSISMPATPEKVWRLAQKATMRQAAE